MTSSHRRTYGFKKHKDNRLKTFKTLLTRNTREWIMDKLNLPSLFRRLQLISNKMQSLQMSNVKYNNVSFLKLLDKKLLA